MSTILKLNFKLGLILPSLRSKLNELTHCSLVKHYKFIKIQNVTYNIEVGQSIQVHQNSGGHAKISTGYETITFVNDEKYV